MPDVSPVAKRVTITKKPKHAALSALGILRHKDVFYLYYRNKSDDKEKIRIATSTDGFSFTKHKKSAFISTGSYTAVDTKKCNEFSFSEQDGYLNLIYSWTSGKTTTIEKAYSKDLFTWNYEGSLPFSTIGVIVPKFFYRKQQVMYTADTHISVAYSKDLIDWQVQASNILKEHIQGSVCHVSLAALTDKGILLCYHTREKETMRAYVALFDTKDPTKLLWNTPQPLWEQPKEWKNVVPVGIILFENKLLAYYHVPGEGIFAVIIGLFQQTDSNLVTNKQILLKRPEGNPLIAPHPDHPWESFTTFNPAAVFDNGKVHLLYRAQGYDYVSVLGYATSDDGVHITQRDTEPVFAPSQAFDTWKKGRKVAVQYMSGGGYGGCEDPRLTKIGDRLYLTYVAFDGYHPPRVAISSIHIDDFRANLWFWEKPVLISPPDVVDKNAVIFPEKIQGKYVIMHRIYPDILIDFVDSLEFDGTTWLKGEYKISPRPNMWDSRKIGAGAPPIKTKYGWLLIYQSVGEQDSGRYKIGAMLLDLKDPTKVLYRSDTPILEPDAPYENNGFKSGVVYPCGAVVIGDTLYVYYGGSDSYVCVATAKLEEFLLALRFSQITTLKTPIIEQVL